MRSGPQIRVWTYWIRMNDTSLEEGLVEIVRCCNPGKINESWHNPQRGLPGIMLLLRLAHCRPGNYTENLCGPDQDQNFSRMVKTTSVVGVARDLRTSWQRAFVLPPAPVRRYAYERTFWLERS